MGCTSAKQASQPGSFQPNYSTANQQPYSNSQPNANITSSVAAGPTMKIHLKTLTGVSKEMDTPDSVLSLRQLAAEDMKCGLEQIRLIFAGKQLEDGQSLSEHGCSAGGTVHMVLKIAPK